MVFIPKRCPSCGVMLSGDFGSLGGLYVAFLVIAQNAAFLIVIALPLRFNWLIYNQIIKGSVITYILVAFVFYFLIVLFSMWKSLFRRRNDR